MVWLLSTQILFSQANCVYMFVLVATAIVADKSFILVIFQCCWGEVRNIVRCIYREAGTSLAGKNQDNGV